MPGGRVLIAVTFAAAAAPVIGVLVLIDYLARARERSNLMFGEVMSMLHADFSEPWEGEWLSPLDG